MYELFLKGGVVMWPLLGISILALALLLHRGCMLLSLARRPASFAAQQALARVQRGIDTLFLIASIAPLLGLLGTVFGIIKSFSVLSMTQPDSQILSRGLSEALFTTAAGLIIALPCQVAGHFLQQHLDRLTARKEAGSTNSAPCDSGK